MKYHNQTKFYSFIYAILVLITIIAVLFCFDLVPNFEKTTYWQDYATFDWDTKVEKNDAGEDVLVYEISTPRQLAGVFVQSKMVSAEDFSDVTEIDSKIYRLKNDIDLDGMSWTPSALNSGYTIDGNFFKILNLRIVTSGQTVGFVSENKGTIKDLYFDSIYVKNDSTDSNNWIGTGGVCGYNNGTITNVIVIDGYVTGPQYKANNDRQTGGIAGRNGGTVKYCINHASVGRSKFSGGIVGYSNGGTITNCTNYGYVSCGRNQYVRAGGIIGETGNSNTTVTGNVNFGGISTGGDDNSNPSNFLAATQITLGGIVGYSQSSVSKCANYGTVFAINPYVAGYLREHQSSYAGGIAGYSTTSISDCYNMGDVKAEAKKTSSTENTGVKTYNEFEVHHHYNVVMGVDSLYYTRQTVNKTTKTENAYAGGIAGYGTSVTYSYSVGNITGGYSYESYTINHTLKAEKVANILGIPSGIKSSDTWSLNQTVYRYTGAYCKAIANGATVSNCYYYGELIDNRSGSDGGYSDGAVFVSPGAIVDNWLITYNFAYGTNASQSIQKSLSEIHNANGRNSDATVYFTASASNGTFKYVVKVDSGYPDSANNEKDVNNNGTILNFTISNLAEKATSKTESEIKNLNMGSAWSKNSNINNGFPYLKDLYW